jgi:hypothetical protein
VCDAIKQHGGAVRAAVGTLPGITFIDRGTHAVEGHLAEVAVHEVVRTPHAPFTPFPRIARRAAQRRLEAAAAAQTGMASAA